MTDDEIRDFNDENRKALKLQPFKFDKADIGINRQDIIQLQADYLALETVVFSKLSQLLKIETEKLEHEQEKLAEKYYQRYYNQFLEEHFGESDAS